MAKITVGRVLSSVLDTVKAVVRGGAKGTTTEADVTSSALGPNHQGLDVFAASPQSLDTGNTKAITVADASPGVPWVGTWAITRSLGYVRQLTVLASNVSSGLGGTFTFEFSEDGVSATISETRTIADFATVRDFDLINAGAYYRVKFEPSRVLVGGETVFVTTTQRTQNDGAFVRLAGQEIEEQNAALPSAFAYAKGFDADTGKSVNVRPNQHTIDTGNRLQTPLTNGALLVFTTDFTTDIFTSVGHGLANGDPVCVTTTGTLPAPLTATTTSTATPPVTSETVYWVRDAAADTFKLSSSPTGSAVNLTDNGSGVHSVQRRGTFVGTFKEVSQIGSLLNLFLSDIKPALVRVEWSSNGTTQNTDLFATSTLATRLSGTFWVALTITNTMTAKYRRVRIVNGPTNQGPVSLFQSFVQRDTYQGSYAGLDEALSIFSTALLTRSVQAAFTPDEAFQNVRTQGRHTANSSTTPLPGNTGADDHVFRGTWFEWQSSFVGLAVDMTADVPGTLFIDFSQETAPINGTDASIDGAPSTVAYDPLVTPLLRRHIPIQSRWVRLRYVNGLAAQAAFNLDVVFMTTQQTESLQPIGTLPASTNLASMAQVVGVVERHEVADALVRVKATRASNGKDGSHVHVTGFEPSVRAAPFSAFDPNQLLVGPTRVQIPPPTLLTVVDGLTLTNCDADTDVYYGGATCTARSLSDVILARGGKDLHYGTGDGVPVSSVPPVYLIAENLGAATATGDRSPATTQSNSGVVSPNNLLTSNDTYATFDDQADSVQATGFTAAGVQPDILSIKLKLEAKKGTNATVETVAWEATSTGATAGAGTVASASIAGGAEKLYVVAISRNSATGTVTGVSGLGLTWIPSVVNVTNGGRRLDVWYAYGTATTGAVTATMSVATNAHISVSRFSNADPTTPIEDTDSTTATSTSVSTPTMTGTSSGMAFTAITHESTSTPGGTYVERSDETNGTGSNIDALTTQTKALTVTGNEIGTATLAGSSEWGVIGITIRPRAAVNPQIRVTYKVGTDPTGPTTLLATLTSTSDATFEADITGDRSWLAANIANVVLTISAEALGAADALVDHVCLAITEIEADVTARVTYAWLGRS